jgi:hypothetical protein
MAAESAPTGTHTGYLPHPHGGRLIDLRSQATEKALTLAEGQQNVGMAERVRVRELASDKGI